MHTQDPPVITGSAHQAQGRSLDVDLDSEALRLLCDLQSREHITRHCRLCRLFATSEFQSLGARRLHAVADALDPGQWLVQPIKDALRAMAELDVIRQLGVRQAAAGTDPRMRSATAAVFGRPQSVLHFAIEACLRHHFTGRMRP